MNCWNCGKEFEQAATCPFCGQPAVKPEAQATAAPVNAVSRAAENRMIIKYITLGFVLIAAILRFVFDQAGDAIILDTGAEFHHKMTLLGKCIVYSLFLVQGVLTLILAKDAKKKNQLFGSTEVIFVIFMVLFQVLITFVTYVDTLTYAEAVAEGLIIVS